MIYIDNRILIPILAPFFILGNIRLLAWLAGAPWSDPGALVVLSCVFGWGLGAAIAASMFMESKSIGGFWIGSKKQ